MMRSDPKLEKTSRAVLRQPQGCKRGCHSDRRCLGGSTPAGSASEEGRQTQAGPKAARAGPFPRKQGRPFVSLYQLSSKPTYPKPSVMTFFMFPLLTASRYSESNFTGSKLSHQLSKQKTLPDCCPTSTPAYNLP